MKARNVDGDFSALIDGPGRVRVELDVPGLKSLSIAWVTTARDAERMGKALIAAAKGSRNKRALARRERAVRDLFTLKPGDV